MALLTPAKADTTPNPGCPGEEVVAGWLEVVVDPNVWVAVVEGPSLAEVESVVAVDDRSTVRSRFISEMRPWESITLSRTEYAPELS